MIYTQKFTFPTQGICDVVDVTSKVIETINESQIKNGVVIVFVVGSTASVTTIETNAGLEEDLKEALEKIAPENHTYSHDSAWGDGNGFSHIRASLIGPSLSVPLIEGEMPLSLWQQIVICDFDNNPRDREVVVQIIGE